MSIITVKTKLDPTPSQERALRSNLGGARFAYNACLAHFKAEKDAGNNPYITFYNIRNWWNDNKEQLAPWYAENSKEAYASGCAYLDRAFKNFYDSCSGKRKDRVGYPKPKKKTRWGSYLLSSGSFKVNQKRLWHPKIGWIHAFENMEKRVNGRKKKGCYIRCDGDNWFACIFVETTHEPYKSHKKEYVGADLGLLELITLSDGKIYENPKHLKKKETNLKRYNRMVSRRQGAKKGEKKSKRYKRACAKRRKQERKIRNKRRDYIDKVTTEICKTYKVVCIEDLKVSNLLKNHNLAKHIQDADWGLIRGDIERKSERFSNTVFVVDRFYPSSKTCSGCGEVKTKLTLDDRDYECEKCGLKIDRDLNAAINLEMVARNAQETLKTGQGEHVRLLSLEEIEQCFRNCQSGKQIRPEALAGNSETTGDDLVDGCTRIELLKYKDSAREDFVDGCTGHEHLSVQKTPLGTSLESDNKKRNKKHKQMA